MNVGKSPHETAITVRIAGRRSSGPLAATPLATTGANGIMPSRHLTTKRKVGIRAILARDRTNK